MPPAVTAEDIGGQSALVIVEVLVDPAGKVAEAKVRKAPAEIMDAVLAAVKQWEYRPHIVDGKAVWIRLVSSVQIRPMEGAPGASDAALGVQGPAASAAATSAGTGTNASASTKANLETVRVSTGVSRDSGRPVTLVTRGGQDSLREAFLIAYPAGSRQAISFNGTASVLGRPDSQLAVLPATGRGWVFLPPKAMPDVKDVTTPPAEVRVASITKVPLGTARSHQQLEATLMRAR